MFPFQYDHFSGSAIPTPFNKPSALPVWAPVVPFAVKPLDISRTLPSTVSAMPAGPTVTRAPYVTPEPEPVVSAPTIPGPVSDPFPKIPVTARSWESWTRSIGKQPQAVIDPAFADRTGASWFRNVAAKAQTALEAAKAIQTATPAPAGSAAEKAVIDVGTPATASPGQVPAGTIFEAGMFSNPVFKKPSFWLGTAAFAGMIAILSKTNGGPRRARGRRR